MNFFAIYLAHKRIVVVKREWVQNPVVRTESLFFYSKDENAAADFTAQTFYYINKDVSACYNGFILQGFGEYKFNLLGHNFHFFTIN